MGMTTAEKIADIKTRIASFEESALYAAPEVQAQWNRLIAVMRAVLRQLEAEQ